MEFGYRAGGNDFIARLWATRRIGDLLNQIRLNGENAELVDSVVSLSIRYGIITPYTSFLITEDDILSQQGQAAAEQAFTDTARQLNESSFGAGAVSAADASGNLANASAPLAAMPTQAAPQSVVQPGLTATPAGTMQPGTTGGFVGTEEERQQASPIQYVGEKTFILQGEVWTDTTFAPDTMTPRQIVFLSDEYFAFLAQHPEAAAYFAVGEQVIVVVDGEAIQVVLE
jgi:Ca-activated chloride channel family protein